MSKKAKKIFEIDYPGLIKLSLKTDFVFRCSKEYYKVTLVKHSMPVVLKDFSNTLTLDKEKQNLEIENTFNFISNENTHVIENKECLFAIQTSLSGDKILYNQYYTKLTLVFEVYDAFNYGEVENKLWKFLNHFIEVYRNLTQDYELLTAKGIHPEEILFRERGIVYSADELKLDQRSRLDLLSHKGVFRRSDVSKVTLGRVGRSVPREVEIIEDNTRSLLEFSENITDEALDLSKSEFLVKIKEELFVKGNYKYAFLDSFILAERIISKAIEREKIRRGIPEKRLKDFELDLKISYMISVELPIIFPDSFPPKSEIIENLNKIRRKRNDIVHKGHEVSLKEAKNALEVILRLIEVFDF